MKKKTFYYNDYWDQHNLNPKEDPTTARRLNLLIRTLKKYLPTENTSILDAGCGSGYFSNFLKKEDYQTVGLDLSENAIKKARDLYLGIDFKLCSLEDKLPFKDSEFNAVWSSEVIEHIYDIYNYFREVNRILKPGGLFIFTTPYHILIKNLGIILFNFDKHFCNIEGGHIRFFSGRCLKKLLKRFDFQIIEKKYIGRIWPFSKSIYIVGKKISNNL